MCHSCSLCAAPFLSIIVEEPPVNSFTCSGHWVELSYSSKPIRQNAPHRTSPPSYASVSVSSECSGWWGSSSSRRRLDLRSSLSRSHCFSNAGTDTSTRSLKWSFGTPASSWCMIDTAQTDGGLNRDRQSTGFVFFVASQSDISRSWGQPLSSPGLTGHDPTNRRVISGSRTWATPDLARRTSLTIRR